MACQMTGMHSTVSTVTVQEYPNAERLGAVLQHGEAFSAVSNHGDGACLGRPHSHALCICASSPALYDILRPRSAMHSPVLILLHCVAKF
jgi:hypothetical protein